MIVVARLTYVADLRSMIPMLGHPNTHGSYRNTIITSWYSAKKCSSKYMLLGRAEGGHT